MTAIAGLCGRGDAGARCAAMLAAQAAYSRRIDPPWCGDDAALARGLFPAVPEDDHDRGPIERDGHILVADVRIDNRAELAGALREGSARALSDSALLMAALLRWGEGALDRLEGDYAFAWWHRAERRLLLARDPSGQRPLVYHTGDGWIGFASMPSGLHALPEVGRRADLGSLARFLSAQPEAPDATYFSGVNRVRAGHVLRWQAGRSAVRRWWTPSLEPLRLKGDADLAEGLREQLDRACAAQLRRRGPAVAAHLSGGLDSGSIAATAARLSGARPGTGTGAGAGTVIAYTSVPQHGWMDADPSALVDEWPLAAQVAAMWPDIEHVRIAAGGASPLPAIAAAARFAQRPVLNPCNAGWVNRILDDARARGLSVLLTGQKGNLAFSHDGLAGLSTLLHERRWGALTRAMRDLRRGGMRAGKIARRLTPPEAIAAIDRLRGRSARLVPAGLIHPSLLEEVEAGAQAMAREMAAATRAPGALQLWLLGHSDLGFYNQGTVGGWGVETRDPTAHRGLVEFALRVPAEQHLTGGVTRSLVRRAMADRLPPAVLAERRRGIQGADWYTGLAAARGALIAEGRAIAHSARGGELIDVEAMTRMLDALPGDGSIPVGGIAPYRQALLRALSAGHFLRMADGDGADGGAAA